MDTELEDRVREFMRPFDHLLQEYLKTAGMKGTKQLTWGGGEAGGEKVQGGG